MHQLLTISSNTKASRNQNDKTKSIPLTLRLRDEFFIKTSTDRTMETHIAHLTQINPNDLTVKETNIHETMISNTMFL